MSGPVSKNGDVLRILLGAAEGPPGGLGNQNGANSGIDGAQSGRDTGYSSAGWVWYDSAG